ncbi:MAG: hypothetical protein KOO60_05600 [Gemmatimonadales bacterium]|nr:hypothetical protein [Gemmatimonadales bacterium]
MLISKRSRRKSILFQSRFQQGSGVEFPLRQYLRCREELVSEGVQGGLWVVFGVTLIFFGRTLNDMFLNHGDHLSPMYRWAALGTLFVFILSVLRRLYYKVVDMKEIRREMERLKMEFRGPEK